MKKLLIGILTFFLSFGGAVNVFAYSGEYIDVFEKSNDTLSFMESIEDEVEKWFSNEKGIHRVVDFDFYSKIDAPASSGSWMRLTFDSGNFTGTWTTDDPIEFYTVKASNQFALYWIDGGATQGFWSTEHLQNKGGKQPQISHLSTWNTLESSEIPSNPVPEPGTMILLGIGILGLAGVGRKVNS